VEVDVKRKGAPLSPLEKGGSGKCDTRDIQSASDQPIEILEQNRGGGNQKKKGPVVYRRGNPNWEFPSLKKGARIVLEQYGGAASTREFWQGEKPGSSLGVNGWAIGGGEGSRMNHLLLTLGGKFSTKDQNIVLVVS